ncbi:hypothetical protein BP6252_05114 [Coleophoma cylindrospora]|uniref:BTB domain-containing protein n=1 Tax=Coleophoma cylindrospora TaxID=1849047 RepID=A0A3D8RTC0_9HELO|nr:hypothetical protein BP6252_05114 [Coleophoma cylindrospora]
MFPSTQPLTRKPIDRRLAIVSELDSVPVAKPSARERREETVSELEASPENSVVYRSEKRREQTVSELSAPDVSWPGNDEGKIHLLDAFHDPIPVYTCEQPQNPFAAELDTSQTPNTAYIPDGCRSLNTWELEGSSTPALSSERLRSHKRTTTSGSDPPPIPQRIFNWMHKDVLSPSREEHSSFDCGPSKLKKRHGISSSGSHVSDIGLSPRSAENNKPQEGKIVVLPSDFVQFRNGDNKLERVTVPRRTVYRYSKFLKKQFDSPLATGNPPTCTLENFDSDVFGMFIRWWSKQQLELRHHGRQNAPEVLEFLTWHDVRLHIKSCTEQEKGLLELWAISKELEMPDLQWSTTDGLLKMYRQCHWRPLGHRAFRLLCSQLRNRKYYSDWDIDKLDRGMAD